MALEGLFASLDNNLPTGRIGTDVASAAVGAGAGAALGHFGVAGLEMDPLTIGAGAVAGVVVSEAVRLVAVDEEKYLAARLEGLNKTTQPLSERLAKLQAEKSQKAS